MLSSNAREEDKTQIVRTVPAPVISDYNQTFIPCYTKQEELRIAIRCYQRNNDLYYLIVNPYTFATECSPVTDFAPRVLPQPDKAPVYFTKQEIDATPYRKALIANTSAPYKLLNHGKTHSSYPIHGAFLTIDMCPSVRKFEANFFQSLLNYSDGPTPIAICISGLWLVNHPEEMQWFMTHEENKKLKITWVNHSFSHIYYADLETPEYLLNHNCLLSAETNLDHEILTTEKLLIRNYQSPSVFFRAPRLAADEKLISKLKHHGLIPIGTNAWLAKNEEAKEGSIILVHGNSNEPVGIEKMAALIVQKKFQFFPLAQAFPTEEPQTPFSCTPVRP
jgi:hypothetical protein